ncbi:Nif3-like dinuclear metal center hexameric protein [Planctomycetes bacterium K23_9]|uniref:GTP cyclohydrolase 1 type 2 homolog n=1 Tax=Stieleria marina TaxID=1930275 RepID=A0A517P0M1_9BACT|nr:GTP cyclohydrolase 1 type 2 [Planctomycetes bacterium K23_9]
MLSLEAICGELARIAPLRLAETWDNVGLLVGDRRQSIRRVMTCLTITPAVVDEAIQEKADLIVAHHPLPFKGLQKITSDTVAGAMLLRLIASQTAIYSAHTAFDSAADGINQKWADLAGLASVEPLIPSKEEASPDCLEGAGRVGKLTEPMDLVSLIKMVATGVGATAPRRVGPSDQPIRKVAFACGSGGSFLAAAKRRGCDALITGEATFHTCLEAEALGVGLGLLGHYWSERFAMERLADSLSVTLPNLTIWPSRRESDPIVSVNL